jgi:GDP-4-dehydro-6-deoxy-D-mannose reductase
MTIRSILITGARGFIGRHMTSATRKAFPGAEIVGVDLTADPLSSDRVVNLVSADETSHLIAGLAPDYIFHCAGVLYSNDWWELYRGNVQASINVMEAVKINRLKSRIVIPGSAAEYGRVDSSNLPIMEGQLPRPATPYGVAKLWTTAAAGYYSETGVDVIVGRLFNVIGNGLPATLSIGSFVKQIKKIAGGEHPPSISVGNLGSKSDFIDIADACRAFIALAEKGKSGEVYNICSGEAIAMDQVLSMMVGQSGINIAVEVDPARFKAGDVSDSYGSNKKIIDATGWRPDMSLEKSISRLLAAA